MISEVVLTIPAVSMEAMMLKLGVRAQNHIALCSTGQYARTGRLELLYRSTACVRRLGDRLPEVSRLGSLPLAISVGERPPAAKDVRWFLDVLEDADVPQAVFLALVRASLTIEAFGWMKQADDFLPLDLVFLPGPGMLKLAVRPLWPLHGTEKVRAAQHKTDAVNTGGDDRTQTTQPVPVSEDRGARLDRLRTFLGEGDTAKGEAILQKARELTVVLVGVGRMGSNLALELVKSEVGRVGGLFLVDGDSLEWPNFDCMLLPHAAIGMHKAEAVAQMALMLEPEANVFPIVATLSDRIATEAVAAGDIIFSCVDDDAPRFGAAALAARYCRTHFDLAGGAAYTDSGNVVTGGEVRLAVPAAPGCVACFSDFDLATARQELSLSADAELRKRLTNDPHAQRPGSSGALNNSVVGSAMHLFWKLLAGNQRRPVWLHLDANGLVPTWHDWTYRARSGGCSVCSSSGLIGLGDWDCDDIEEKQQG